MYGQEIATGLVFGEKPSVGIEPTNLPDRSRYKNHGTHTDITMVQLPNGLWVRDCDGSTGRVTIADSDSLDLLSALSIIWWLYLDPADPVMDGNLAYLFSKGASFAYSAYWDDRVTDRLSVRHLIGTATVPAGELTISTAGWYLIGVTWDKSSDAGLIRNYKNGIYQASTATEVNDISVNAFPFLIAALYKVDAPFFQTPSSIKFALFRIKHYAISAGEMKTIFESERHWFGV